MVLFLNTYKAKFSIICLLFLYTSCCSLRGTEVKEYYFKTILAEKFIPNLPDSVNFRDQNNQRHYFNQVEYDRYYDDRNECQHCCEDNEIEKSHLYYLSDAISFNIRLDLVARKKVDLFSIEYDTYYPNNSTDTGFLQARSFYIKRATSADSLYLHLDAQIPFYSSITLLSRTFNNVYVFETNVVTDKKYPQQIYYNTEQGIVGIRFNNHDFWELVD